MIYCGKSEFGQIPRSFSLNSGAMPKAFAAAKALASLMGWAPLIGQALRLKRPGNLTQIGFPSLRSVKSDRLPGACNCPATFSSDAYYRILMLLRVGDIPLGA